MRILIDISNIIPGKGGAGGGVAVYANNLLEELDNLIEDSKDFILCFKNAGNNTKKYKNIKVIEKSYETTSIMSRLIWLNVYLPFYCLKNKIDVLHRAVPELPFVKVCKYVCTLHDLMYRFHLNKTSQKNLSASAKMKLVLYGTILRRSVLSADYIVVPSHFIKAEATEVFKLSPDKVEVTHLGVFKLPKAKPEVRTNTGKFKFIVVAGFYPHKGHAKVIELTKALISKDCNDFTITFRGNPFNLNIVEDIKHQIEKFKLQEFIHFNDFKKSHDVNNIYASFDSLLLLSEYEGFGLPVLEAQMFGLPVICSNIDIFKEVLQDSAIFVDINDINSSCDRIINFMNDDLLRKNMIEKGFENCERFSWHDMAAQTLRVYKKFEK